LSHVKNSLHSIIYHHSYSANFLWFSLFGHKKCVFWYFANLRIFSFWIMFDYFTDILYISSWVIKLWTFLTDNSFNAIIYFWLSQPTWFSRWNTIRNSRFWEFRIVLIPLRLRGRCGVVNRLLLGTSWLKKADLKLRRNSSVLIFTKLKM
jgi:hypothetical protein